MINIERTPFLHTLTLLYEYLPHQHFRMSRPSYTCLEILTKIKDGTLAFNGITSETLESTGWLWTGPIARLLKTVPRESIIAMTYKGKMSEVARAP